MKPQTTSGILKTACILSCIFLMAGCSILSDESADGTENLHYEIPVIFHILYKDFTDPDQFIPPARIGELISSVNSRFKGSAISQDMNLSFTLAREDEAGNKMDIPGIEYIYWTENYPIDCNSFMSDNSGRYTSYLWDPNRYVNVMVYNFSMEEDNYVTLGISHLPFSVKGDTFLEGLEEIPYQKLEKENLMFPYCVSINSQYIYRESTSSRYDSADANVTLAHELGHYLGLLHVFNEDEYDTGDSDYCDDTPCYSYPAYLKSVVKLTSSGKDSFDYLVRRTSLNGTEFISRNIMDYGCSYSDQFTPDQKSRVRHVLRYSPMIPGPKAAGTKAGQSPAGPVELPVRTLSRITEIR